MILTSGFKTKQKIIFQIISIRDDSVTASLIVRDINMCFLTVKWLNIIFDFKSGKYLCAFNNGHKSIKYYG